MLGGPLERIIIIIIVIIIINMHMPAPMIVLHILESYRYSKHRRIEEDPVLSFTVGSWCE